jgi:hypothetical protein
MYLAAAIPPRFAPKSAASNRVGKAFIGYRADCASV